MKYLNKKTVIYAIIILALSTSLFLFVNKQIPEIPNDGYIQPPKGNTVLSNRDIAIQEALASPDKLLRRTQINGETYLLTGYEEDYKGNKPGWTAGGLIVYKLENSKPVFFWESSENMNRDVAGFMDINSDGIPEIVWDYDLGATGRTNAFYVYKFTNDGFKLITPLYFINDFNTHTSLLSGDSGLTYMKDIDNDGVQEITVGDWKGNIGDNAAGKDIKIYKYDGDKYYLWKEEKIGEEKP